MMKWMTHMEDKKMTEEKTGYLIMTILVIFMFGMIIHQSRMQNARIDNMINYMENQKVMWQAQVENDWKIKVIQEKTQLLKEERLNNE